MRVATWKQGRLAAIAGGFVIVGALGGAAQADVVTGSPTFPPNSLSFSSPGGAGCFVVANACVTPGIFTLTSPTSSFLPGVQDITADATYTGSLTPLQGMGSLGSFTLTGAVALEVQGRTSPTETGSWIADLAGLSLSAPFMGVGTLSVTLDPQHTSAGAVSITPLGQGGDFRIQSFFDIFVDVTLDRPGLPLITTSVGPIGVVAVPEPATWAMLLIGFAGLGFAAQRRVILAQRR